jgi:hypothetical protein
MDLRHPPSCEDCNDRDKNAACERRFAGADEGYDDAGFHLTERM